MTVLQENRRPYDFVKRGLDIVSSLLGLLLLWPVMAVTAVLVRVKLGRPVMFRQPRPGKDAQVFTLYKFRSMKDVDEARDLVTDAQRMTGFGSSLRSTSLDELPSLWNVLRGDMSIVGPRPLLVEYVDLYSPEQARRHEVRPGVTGLAQVRGRNSISWEEKFELDVHYVDQRSFSLDARLVWQTISVVFRQHGISSRGNATMLKFGASDGN